MSSDAQTQVRAILNAVVEAKFKDLFRETGRSLDVSKDAQGVTVTADRIRINPNWAVQVGPIPAIERAIKLSEEYDRRVTNAGAKYMEELKQELAEVLGKIDRIGGDEAIRRLLKEVLGW